MWNWPYGCFNILSYSRINSLGIRNNYIIDCPYYGIQITTLDNNNNNEIIFIENNNITDTGYYSIYTNQSNIIIQNNNITDAGEYGIYTNKGNITIKNNYFFYQKCDIAVGIGNIGNFNIIYNTFKSCYNCSLYKDIGLGYNFNISYNKWINNDYLSIIDYIIYYGCNNGEFKNVYIENNNFKNNVSQFTMYIENTDGLYIRYNAINNNNRYSDKLIVTKNCKNILFTNNLFRNVIFDPQYKDTGICKSIQDKNCIF